MEDEGWWIYVFSWGPFLPVVFAHLKVREQDREGERGSGLEASVNAKKRVF